MESARRVAAERESHRLAKTDRRRQTLEMRVALPPADPNLLQSVEHRKMTELNDALCEELQDLDDDKSSALQELFASQIFGDVLHSAPTFDADPQTPREAFSGPEVSKWCEGARDKLHSLREMGVYRLVPPSFVPPGCKILKHKFVFHKKRDSAGVPVCWKVRLVVKGFKQIYGKDYTATTLPTACHESMRLLLKIAAARDWDIQQTDVKTAFLYGLLSPDEVQYMEQPEGFEEPGKEDWVWQLQCGLYGMKQSGQIWYRTMHDEMIKLGFKRLSSENCIYYRETTEGIVITAVYVNDFLIVGDSAAIVTFKDQLRKIWTISDLGDARFCVGLAIDRHRPSHHVYLSQTALIDRIIETFGQQDAYPVNVPMGAGDELSSPTDTPTHAEIVALEKIPYRSLVGMLLYVAIGTRPDIAYIVNHLARFLSCYRHDHWNAAIRVVCYLKSTRDFKLVLGSKSKGLVGFTDASYGNDKDTCRSIAGYCFSMGSGVITWASRRQKTVAKSTCEAEYVGAADATSELLWLCQLLREIGLEQSTLTPLLCDNNSAISVARDLLFHHKIKHVDIGYHFI